MVPIYMILVFICKANLLSINHVALPRDDCLCLMIEVKDTVSLKRKYVHDTSPTHDNYIMSKAS